MTDTREVLPSRAERKKIRALYNRVGGAMVLQYVLVFAIYIVLSIAFIPFVTEETDPETGVMIIGWADALVQFFSPAIASVVMFFAFNAANRVRSAPMFGTKGITPRLLGYCVLVAFAFHAAGILLEYGVDIVLYRLGLEVTAFDYEISEDAATTAIDLISSIIAAPIAEELFFRGVVLKQTARVSARFGIVFSAVIFGLMHGNPYQFVMATVIGLFFGYITVKTDSLIPTIVCHMAVNGMMCLSDIVGRFVGDEDGTVFYAFIAAEGVLGVWCIMKLVGDGYQPELPPYDEYHKKRTLPIIITSVWVIIAVLLYVLEICGSVEPIASGLAEELVTSAA